MYLRVKKQAENNCSYVIIDLIFSNVIVVGQRMFSISGRMEIAATRGWVGFPAGGKTES